MEKNLDQLVDENVPLMTNYLTDNDLREDQLDPDRIFYNLWEPSTFNMGTGASSIVKQGYDPETNDFFVRLENAFDEETMRQHFPQAAQTLDNMSQGLTPEEAQFKLSRLSMDQLKQIGLVMPFNGIPHEMRQFMKPGVFENIESRRQRLIEFERFQQQYENMKKEDFKRLDATSGVPLSVTQTDQMLQSMLLHTDKSVIERIKKRIKERVED